MTAHALRPLALGLCLTVSIPGAALRRRPARTGRRSRRELVGTHPSDPAAEPCERIAHRVGLPIHLCVAVAEFGGHAVSSL